MRTVVFGNGLLGRELSKQAGWDNFSLEEDGVDITKPESYIRYLSLYDEVINCMAHTDIARREREPSWSINFVGVIDLVDFCNLEHKKLIHISTDHMYAYSGIPAKETGVPIHNNNWYTYTKLLADGYVQAKCKDYLLIRTSFKARPFPWDGAWVGRIGNFDYVDVIAELIIKLIKSGASGICNVGTERKTMYDLAIQTKPSCIKMMDDVFPGDVTMDLSKLNDTLSNNHI